MKRVFIIHGWEGSPEANWLPWMRRELESRGLQVQVPAMPDTDNPEKEAWVQHLADLVGEPDQDTYLIGHSIGSHAILRYLERLPESKKVGGVLSVAGWMNLAMWEGRTEEETAIVESWTNPPLDLAKIRKHSRKFIAIFSDNDPFVPLEGNVQAYRDALGAEIVVEKSAGHLTGEEDGRTEYPIIWEKFLSLTS